MERLVAIWEERKVFGMSGTKPFTELVEAAGTPKKASGILLRPHHPVSGTRVHPDNAQGFPLLLSRPSALDNCTPIFDRALTRT